MTFSADRRQFLTQLGAAALLPGLLLRSRYGFATAQSAPVFGVMLMPMIDKLVVYDSGTRKSFEIPVPNKEPHSVIVNTSARAEALVLDQANYAATLVNLQTRKIIAEAKPNPMFLFSGHGCFTANGKSLYLAEFPSDLKAQGCLTERDPRTLKIRRVIKTGARWSHNVMLLKNESVFAVGHRGSEKDKEGPNSGGLFTFVRASDGNLLEAVKPEDTHYFLNHFDLTADETVVISTQSYYGPKEKIIDLPTPLMIGKMGKKESWRYPLPAALKSRMLHNHTLVVDKARNRALVAHQNGRLVSIWDLNKQEPVKTFDLDDPCGIALSPDGGRYIIGSKSNRTLVVSAATLDVEVDLPGTHFGVSGDGPFHITIIPGIGA